MLAIRHLAALALTAVVLAGPAAAQDGAELFELCVQCHGARGEGNPLVLAPSIAGLQEWYVVAQVENFKSGLRGIHPEDVAGLRMHPMARALKSDGEIRAVAAYVAGLPPVFPEPVVEGGDPQRGATLYGACAACHGVDGVGNETLKAPALHNASDWYLFSSLQRYKSGVRAANPANMNAQIMRGMASTLQDEQAMKDVVAYIMTLSGGQAK